MYGLSDIIREKRDEIKALENKVNLLKKEKEELKEQLSKAYLEMSYNKGNEQ